MLGLFAAIGVIVVALIAGASSSSPSISAALSDVRRRALVILDEVVPSADGDARFAKLGWHAVPGSKATSCGALPGYMGVRLGDPTGITRWGVEGARTEGQKKGAWVVSDGRARPLPGDIFGVSRSPGSIIVHVGVLKDRYIDAQGREVWVTANAGQGPDPEHQSAAYVSRFYDPRTNTLTRDDNGEPRYVEGWINLDKWTFPPAHVSHLVSPADAWRYPPTDQCDGGECFQASAVS